MAKMEEPKFLEDREEKWLKYYSSFHRILLVAEGDFSFSLSLAMSFASATNIVATSLDSYDLVIQKYKKAKSNLDILERLGAALLFGVDATTMKMHCDLQKHKFDRIIYNFPHAGFHGKENGLRSIELHRTLVRNFFRNASGMLRYYGEIHVNHKTTHPFCCWNLEGLALCNSLEIIEIVDFKIEDYPGYNNKRGSGSRCDEPFPLGQCSTFKFRLSPSSRRVPSASNNCNLCHNIVKPNSFELMPAVNIQSQGYNICNYIPHQSLGFLPIAPAVNDVSGECFRIFDGYFKHVLETFGRTDYDVGYFVLEALKYGFKMYMGEAPGRSLTGYINILQELHNLSVRRSAWLKNMLLAPDHRL